MIALLYVNNILQYVLMLYYVTTLSDVFYCFMYHIVLKCIVFPHGFVYCVVSCVILYDVLN